LLFFDEVPIEWNNLPYFTQLLPITYRLIGTNMDMIRLTHHEVNHDFTSIEEDFEDVDWVSAFQLAKQPIEGPFYQIKDSAPEDNFNSEYWERAERKLDPEDTDTMSTSSDDDLVTFEEMEELVHMFVDDRFPHK